jgi:AraC-like DNA-binding protein
MQAKRFAVDPGWQVLLKDMGLDLEAVLKSAQLPADLFSRKNAALSAPEYFRVWNAAHEASNDPSFPLRVGQAVSIESFHPLFFAVLCSPNLNVGMKRLSQFKRLVGPMTVCISESPDSTTITLDCLDADNPIPTTMIGMELVFMVNLARLGTRERVEPMSVSADVALPNREIYAEYFGVPVTHGENNSIKFSASDARRPFVTENVPMWNFFEPELRRRLSDIEKEEGFVVRVRSSLLELLPSGQCSMDAVAKKLAVSKRTLQRRLSEESTTFQVELNKTREKLARHYLSKSDLSGAQISYLLGFEDPNSFCRAYHSWTGQTPNQSRMNDHVQA